MFRDYVVVGGLILGTSVFVSAAKEIAKPAPILLKENYMENKALNPSQIGEVAALTGMDAGKTTAVAGKAPDGEVGVKLSDDKRSVFVRMSPNATEVTTIEDGVAHTRILQREGKANIADEYKRTVVDGEPEGTPSRPLRTLVPGHKEQVAEQVAQIGRAASRAAQSFYVPARS